MSSSQPIGDQFIPGFSKEQYVQQITILQQVRVSEPSTPSNLMASSNFASILSLDAYAEVSYSASLLSRVAKHS